MHDLCNNSHMSINPLCAASSRQGRVHPFRAIQCFRQLRVSFGMPMCMQEVVAIQGDLKQVHAMGHGVDVTCC